MRTSSSLFALAARVLGVRDDIQNVTCPAGIAHTVAQLILLFPQHAARGQLFVPLDLLARHGVIPADIFAGTATPELRAALRELREIGIANLASVGRCLAGTPPAAIPALLPLAVARLQLERMESDYEPFAPREVSLWRRQWAIWRAARNARRIAGA